ncbi:EpsG family protein [Shewanella frigidimarina]|uniref:EpsG family protein n=1 Tax=Shewanella frigidimarina TaxID=56812 RepID=UPI0014042CBF
MIYLLLLFGGTIYFFLDEKYLNSKKFLSVFFIWFPILFFYFIFPATQYNVGTDYFTYRNYYAQPDLIELYRIKGELVFYYIYRFIVENQLGEQSIFYFCTFFNTCLLFFTMFKLRKANFNIAIIFFLFLTITGIYHNQMNGLRAYMGVMCIPLAFVYLAENKLIKTAVLIILAISSHFSSVVSLLLLPMKILIPLSNRKLAFLFFLLPFIYVSLMQLVPSFVNLFFFRYSHYLNSDYATGISLINLFSKLYYLPLFVFFWFVYLKRKPISIYCESSVFRKYFDFSIVVWVVTYWFIILSLEYGFFFRLQSAFIFFYIFPIYYLYQYLIDSKSWRRVSFLSVYILAPYVLKVTYMASGEYNYSNYLFYSF